MTAAAQVTEITPALCHTLRGEIDAALKSVGEAHGVTLALGNIKYNEAEATGKLVITGVGANTYAVGFALVAFSYGLEPSDLGREIQVAGETYTIHGVKGSGKRPIAVRRADGAVCMCEQRVVVQALGRAWPVTSEERERLVDFAKAAKAAKT